MLDSPRSDRHPDLTSHLERPRRPHRFGRLLEHHLKERKFEIGGVTVLQLFDFNDSKTHHPRIYPSATNIFILIETLLFK